MKKGKNGGLKVDVDTALYPVEAVEAAGSMFEGRARVGVKRRGTGCLSVSLGSKSLSPEALVGEFRNELLHQALRLKSSRSSRNIREYIVTKALLSAQQPSFLPPEPACPEGPPQGAAGEPGRTDPELEAEIEKLLTEIEKGDPSGDPLGVAVPWEEKFGKKKAKPSAKKGKKKRR